MRLWLGVGDGQQRTCRRRRTDAEYPSTVEHPGRRRPLGRVVGQPQSKPAQLAVTVQRVARQHDERQRVEQPYQPLAEHLPPIYTLSRNNEVNVRQRQTQRRAKHVKKCFFTFFIQGTFFTFFLPTFFIMRPSSLGGGRILRRTLSVCLSVCLSVRPVRGCRLLCLQLHRLTSEHPK